jgi:ribonuclease R
MDDYYKFDKEHYELIGERNGKKYMLGQKIKVIATGVDTLANTIDFDLAQGE